jgi:Domain of unknown function (DUF4412)
MSKTIAYLTFLIAFILISNNTFAQKEFSGTFTMLIQTSDKTDKEIPLSWYLQPKKDGRMMAMQIMDEQLSKGVNKRVIFNPTDSTWLMLMGVNKIKQGTKIHRAAMFRDSTESAIYTPKKSKETKIINGYLCHKFSLKTKKNVSEIWVTNQLQCNIGFIYKLLRHCGMIETSARKGDWYRSKYIKGMILEIHSQNLASGDDYTMKITDLQLGVIKQELLNIEGYRISVIPEGQNCGVQEIDN